MRNLTINECSIISGASLTERQVDSILGKVGAYSAQVCFLGAVYCAGYIGLPALLLCGGGSVAKIAGTYVFYDNKEVILEKLNVAKDYVETTWQGFQR